MDFLTFFYTWLTLVAVVSLVNFANFFVNKNSPNITEWDIVQDTSSELFGMGGSVYKDVETCLLAPLLLSASSRAGAGQSPPALSSSIAASAKASPKALEGSSGSSADSEIYGKRTFDSDSGGSPQKKAKTA